MLIKSAPVQLKAVDAETGIFEAIVSVFGNKDSYGDVVVPGAFAESIADWEASGDPVPIYWSHQMSDPDFNIGHCLELKEIDKGLWVKGQLDLADALPGNKAPQVHRLMKGRRVTQFSFAYDIAEAGWVENDEDSWYELRKLKIHEVGPTPIGANQDTELLTVKAAAASASRLATSFKAGRAISAKNEDTLRKALESIEGSASQIKDVLSAIDGGEASADDDTKSSEPAKDEETSRSKSEEPMRPDAVKEAALLNDLAGAADEAELRQLATAAC